jgi:hypothetical protein
MASAGRGARCLRPTNGEIIVENTPAVTNATAVEKRRQRRKT